VAHVAYIINLGVRLFFTAAENQAVKDLFYFFLPGEKWLALLLLLGRVTFVCLISLA
jgi:hypothetical protein